MPPGSFELSPYHTQDETSSVHPLPVERIAAVGLELNASPLPWYDIAGTIWHTICNSDSKELPSLTLENDQLLFPSYIRAVSVAMIVFYWHLLPLRFERAQVILAVSIETCRSSSILHLVPQHVRLNLLYPHFA